MKKPVVLCIMDGYGHNENTYGNAIAAAKTPRIDDFFANNPLTYIGASGMDVGLPVGQMGNSEVGHTNIGAGRVVYQDLTRISKAIDDGDFFENEVLLKAMQKAVENNKSLHLAGLISDGGVHSHNTHLYALLEMAKQNKVKDLYIHCIMDGRDVPPTSGKAYVAELSQKIDEIGLGQIATIMGRYYCMDREKKFDRVEKAYRAMVDGEGKTFEDADALFESSYNDGVTDEFILPSVSQKAKKITDGDSLIFFNFRPDRAREITRAFVDEDFTGFDRNPLKNLFYVCMTQYDATIENVEIAFAPQSLDKPLGAVLSDNNLTQLRIAEYTKYAHVTFFLNGGEETVYKGEDRILIDSPNVATYDLKPEMSAYEVTDIVEEKVKSGIYDVIVINYANCDMVGHTGVFDAAVKAVEAVDTCVGRLWDAVASMGGIMLITADHGNADKMIEEDGSPFTAHTTNPVPFCILGKECKLKDKGRLCDIAPTMLEIMDLPQPKDMTGTSLLQ